MEAVETATEAASLAQAYMGAGVVPGASRVGATHVAPASVARADAVVSWNSRTLCSCAASVASTPSTCCAAIP